MARARELARDQLTAWGLETLVDTTELLVSELVTNALRHGDGEIRLRLLLRPHPRVRGVGRARSSSRAAAAPATPTRAAAGCSSSACSARAWGSRRTPRGKTVWFELALPDGDSAAVDPTEALLSMY